MRGGGTAAEPIVVLTGTHSEAGTREAYYLPVDTDGLATLRFQTDARGRRRGFDAILRAIDTKTDSQSFLSGEQPCPIPGQSGYSCEISHCINKNRLNKAHRDLVAPGPFTLGRVVSQVSELPIPAMPWASHGGCKWILTPEGLPFSEKKIGAFRFVLNKPFDLEPFPVTDVGDKLVIRQEQRTDQFSEIIFSESCENDEACSFQWQTGECSEKGACIVRTTFEVPVEPFDDSEEPLLASILLITDRNDGGESYSGLDFDVYLVQEYNDDVHCEDAGGTCVDEFCYCSGIACSRPCGERPDVVSSGVKIGIVLGVRAPIFACMFVGFYLYRRCKIEQSRAQKKIIEEKEAELEQFRNSVIGMRAVINDYVPVVSEETKETARALPKVQWCWKETDFCMDNHDEDEIFGPTSDCWIKYKNSNRIEKKYQRMNGTGVIKPLDGYTLDFETMIQTKTATGFQREVKRFVEETDLLDVNMDHVEVGEGLPSDLEGEPQMILVKGDIIQISRQREDDWAFGSKMHYANEALARQLLAVALAGQDCTSEDILTDTGWFPLDKTRPPSSDDLAVLQSQVGDTGELAPPPNWEPVADATTVQLYDLKEGNQERDAVVNSFLSTLVPPQFPKVKIVWVQRIQNLAMWQSYVVKRQTVCYRENYDPSSGSDSASYKKAMERFERKWLWHGTNSEVMHKILQQGFNRSFCGKNATVSSCKRIDKKEGNRVFVPHPFV